MAHWWKSLHFQYYNIYELVSGATFAEKITSCAQLVTYFRQRVTYRDAVKQPWRHYTKRRRGRRRAVFVSEDKLLLWQNKQRKNLISRVNSNIRPSSHHNLVHSNVKIHSRQPDNSPAAAEGVCVWRRLSPPVEKRREIVIKMNSPGLHWLCM